MRWLGALLAMLLAASAWSATDIYPFDSSAERHRFTKLTSELRCLVCQNETLAESAAMLAADLREEIYTRIRTGQTDNQIIQYLVSRYGNFILYRPPLGRSTFFLWFGPLIFLVSGFAVLAKTLFSKRKTS